ncbi:calcium-binding protein [Rhodobacteraceae bacterium KMM 6894]|nr:calcium-binding protein [Rhodobacteraceae bacterium KMM 6894]
MPNTTINATIYSGPLQPTDLLQGSPVILLGLLSSSASGTIADDNGTLGASDDDSSTFKGQTITYIGSGTVRPGVDVAGVVVPLGASVDVVAFKADGITYFHYPNGNPGLLGAVALIVSMTSAPFELFTNPYIGTTSADTFTGDAFGNTMTGDLGNDSISGGDGADTIDGGAGNDTLLGGTGADSILGGDGDDYIDGNFGTDTLDGGAGNDTLDFTYTASNVSLNLDAGTAVFTSATTESITRFENVVAGSGDNDITGTSDANRIDGGAGDDTIDAGAGDDVIIGGTGDDRVYDRSGNDDVQLGDGDDYVRAGGGADTYDGGAGTDYISYYDSSSGVSLDFAANTASRGWANNDTVLNFEGASGSKTGDDTIKGTDGDNLIRSYGGDDLIETRGGNDSVYDGIGNDTVDLGAGDDYVSAGGGADSYDGGDGVDYINYYDSTGGIRLDFAANTASHGWANNDTVKNFEGASGSNTGDDIIKGTDGANKIETHGGDDKLHGRAGDDILDGGAGNDSLYGASGSDTMKGGDGNDYLDGGSGTGTDYLYGGSGADEFHFDRGEGYDVIKDFEDDIDTLVLDNFSGFTTAADALVFATEVDGDVLFDFGTDGSVLVENTTMALLMNDIDIV